MPVGKDAKAQAVALDGEMLGWGVILHHRAPALALARSSLSHRLTLEPRRAGRMSW